MAADERPLPRSPLGQVPLVTPDTVRIRGPRVAELAMGPPS
jgi:hypothetical protein